VSPKSATKDVSAEMAAALFITDPPLLAVFDSGLSDADAREAEQD
jgi:hypothetical protein